MLRNVGDWGGLCAVEESSGPARREAEDFDIQELVTEGQSWTVLARLLEVEPRFEGGAGKVGSRSFTLPASSA